MDNFAFYIKEKRLISSCRIKSKYPPRNFSGGYERRASKLFLPIFDTVYIFPNKSIAFKDHIAVF